METRSTDITEGLHALGKGGSPVPQQSPGIDILEAFPNRFPGRDYIISISFPEFTGDGSAGLRNHCPRVHPP